MTVATHTFSYLLKHSGDVLSELEHRDVMLERRDGEDVLVSPRHRAEAVKDSLGMAMRVIAGLLGDAELAPSTLRTVTVSIPWTAWLSVPDQEEFFREFVVTARSCNETDYYEPLARLLYRWKVSAEIVHDPALSELLNEDRGPDDPVVLARPVA
jgi:hypothetical protein